MRNRILLCWLFPLTVLISACAADPNTSYPQIAEDQRKEARGKLTGEGLSIFGDDEEKNTPGTALGVNSFLWRATLDTLSFMPLASADPFGGVVLTDWYEDPKTPGERFKVNALILDKTLRADGVRISLFKQTKTAQGQWADAPVDNTLSRKLEDSILTRARQLRVAQLPKK